MPLLVDETNIFDIEVCYREEKDLIFYDELPIPGDVIKEKFTFKKPSWRDFRQMMSSSCFAHNGVMTLNPYVFMDLKIKLLLKGWTLTKDSKPLPVTSENIDSLNPSLCTYLAKKVDAFLGDEVEDVSKEM